MKNLMDGYAFVSWKPKGKGRPSSNHITYGNAARTLCDIKVPTETSNVTVGETGSAKSDCDVCGVVMHQIQRHVSAMTKATRVKITPVA